MTAPIENRTRLRGTVLGRRPHPDVARWDVLTLDAAAAEPVDGWTDLLSGARGQVEVNVDASDLPEGDLVGWIFVGVVRVVGSGAIAALPAAAPGASTTLSPPDGPILH
ncbi:hypothetical protein [Propioniciclava soli]|uniref:Uncharacterized protein n=1 Tax=Propioniciclava soli TaxID=2775081 RepID=A0ABZ3C3A6_9ACTN|nr:hypothetical protein [Propioniciclava soli]